MAIDPADDLQRMVKVRALTDVRALRLAAGDKGVFPEKSVSRYVEGGSLAIVDPQVERWGRVVGATIEPITE